MTTLPSGRCSQAEWDVPVYLGNDANCAAIGEYWAGAAKDCDPAVVVTLGTGIGGAWWWAASCTPASPSPGWRWAT